MSELDLFSSPISPKRKRDSICTNDTDDDDNDTDNNTDKLRTAPDATENVALQPTTPSRLLGRLRARSPFRRTVSVRRTSSSRLVASTATESRDGDDDGDDDCDDSDKNTPTKRARRDAAVLTAAVVKKTRGRLLSSSQKRFVRLAGATLSFAADDVTASFFEIFCRFFFFFSTARCRRARCSRA